MKKIIISLSFISLSLVCSKKQFQAQGKTALECLHASEQNKSNERIILIGDKEYHGVPLLGATDDKGQKELRDKALNELLKLYSSLK